MLSFKSTCDDYEKKVIRDDLSLFYVSPSKLHPLLMYESIELLFPQSLEGASKSRHVSASEGSQPLQCKLTLNIRLSRRDSTSMLTYSFHQVVDRR